MKQAFLAEGDGARMFEGPDARQRVLASARHAPSWPCGDECLPDNPATSVMRRWGWRQRKAARLQPGETFNRGPQ